MTMLFIYIAPMVTENALIKSLNVENCEQGPLPAKFTG